MFLIYDSETDTTHALTSDGECAYHEGAPAGETTQEDIDQEWPVVDAYELMQADASDREQHAGILAALKVLKETRERACKLQSK